MPIDPSRQLDLTPPLTANERWFSALLRHQIFSLRFAGSLRNDTIEILNATERDISMRIRDQLRGVQQGSPTALRRANRLINEIREIRGAAWGGVDRMWRTTLQDFAREEVRFLKAGFEASIPVVAEATLPDASTLRSLVREQPFQGRLLKEWSNNIRRADLRRIEDQIKIGVVQGEGSDVIARRVVGTARLRGRDGVLQITRHNAQAITRTAVNHFSNAARQEFLEENREFFTREVYTATLDSRTTPICSSLDGERFEIGKGPMPPLHIQCRSLRVAVLDDELLGSRPMKPVTERMLLREFSEQRGIRAPGRRAGLPRGTKGEFDRFARQRTRELVGKIPAKTTYQEWLRTQSTEFQNDVLGPTKAKLFREGRLTLKKFVNRAGDEIPLRDLARIEADAFRAAGLDPGDFR